MMYDYFILASSNEASAKSLTDHEKHEQSDITIGKMIELCLKCLSSLLLASQPSSKKRRISSDVM